MPIRRYVRDSKGRFATTGSAGRPMGKRERQTVEAQAPKARGYQTYTQVLQQKENDRVKMAPPSAADMPLWYRQAQARGNMTPNERVADAATRHQDIKAKLNNVAAIYGRSSPQYRQAKKTLFKR